MKSFLFLLALFGFAASLEQDLDDLKNLNQDMLYKAMKHQAFQDDPTFSDEDKKLVKELSEEELRDLVKQTPNDAEMEDEAENDGIYGDDKDDDEDDFKEKKTDDEANLEETLSDDEITEIAEDELPETQADPGWGRRRSSQRRRWLNIRRRSTRRRGGILKFYNNIRSFLRKHGARIKRGIRGLRRAIWKCCRTHKFCRGKWFCRFGSYRG